MDINIYVARAGSDLRLSARLLLCQVLDEPLLPGAIVREVTLNNTRLLPLDFTPDTYGKPFAAGVHGRHVSWSHSGSYVAVALCERPCGVDVEFADGDVVRRRFMPHEQALPLSTTAIWVMKESLLKCAGVGLMRLSHCVIEPGESEEGYQAHVDGVAMHTWVWPFAHGFVGAAALDADVPHHPVFHAPPKSA
ncbi:MAG: hypothetical protein FWF49_02490 [Oscillospiraceae bacterium]|nr:hypothetical protein [Oscillospiraceae bacterium]